MVSKEYSISPEGEKFPLPTKKDHKKEFDKLKKIVKAQRKLSREIVVVVGVGFVGAVMAAVVSYYRKKKGKPH